MGMPIFAGFWGKLALLKALFAGTSTLGLVGAVVVLLSVVLEGVYFLRIGHTLFERDTEQDNEPAFNEATPTDAVPTLMPVLFLALLTLCIGVLPGLLHGFLGRAAEDLVNAPYYIEHILATVVGGL
jgi:formate hydrogenlyase subunit 3/multisubunit Na+/H+ antiporter MnhD subunit